ncbi:MAG: SEC-C metal-binding domain-containing protein [Gemmataceae bacterium]|nr:SEC-C metal-binding domain-containing protein [Gemmataceae bacterium]
MGLPRYDREGLYRWYQARFAGRVSAPTITEEEFRTETRSRILEKLYAVSRAALPEATPADLDAKLAEEFAGAKYAEEADAEELAQWCRAHLGLDVSPQELTGKTIDETRHHLWNAYDAKYRPEMKRVERGLLLDRLDRAWKNHLYVMDHLRQGIGLVGYAQIDPKTEYKRQGMKEFDAMWEGLSDKVTDAIFRLENDEAFEESVWLISSTIHDEAPRALVSAQEQQQADASTDTPKKIDPIRKSGAKVGRNDACPCGSGKKYKHCCMRKVAV